MRCFARNRERVVDGDATARCDDAGCRAREENDRFPGIHAPVARAEVQLVGSGTLYRSGSLLIRIRGAR